METFDWFLCLVVVWLVQAARMNWEDTDRSTYCPCFPGAREARVFNASHGLSPRPGLFWRLRVCRVTLDALLDYPTVDSLSTCFAAFGVLLGYFVKRDYVRVPLDELYFYTIDEFQALHGCIQAESHMPSVEGVKTCPTRLRMVGKN